ncbi:MAG TPA: class I SAM-dependent methyltransferase [Myxococcales bacterium]|jgi:SAM-dependent methyltransferase
MPKPKPQTFIADRFALYEEAVQEPEDELALLEGALRRAGRPAVRLREDFSGTALLSATWVGADPRRVAVAVDNDPAVHDWARLRRLPRLGQAAKRLRLVQADVRRGPRGPFDAIVALNFSYRALHARKELKDYLRGALRALAPGGVLMLDAYGGWLTQQGLTERRKLGGGLTYVWEHDDFDPITCRARASIHFERSGGRRLPGAFHYDWRLWSLPELTDLLEEVGFTGLEVLWDVEPEGVPPRYLPRRSAENQPAWLAYLFARRPRRRAGRKGGQG